VAELKTISGSDVLYRHWPAGGAKAALLLVYGFGAPGERWNFFADHFSGKGFACYALELRGLGETKERPRGHIDSFDRYYQDLRAMAALIKKENPGKKIFLAGDSLGGVLSFVMAASDPDLFQGLICMSPYFKNVLKFSLLDYLILLPALLFNPRWMIDAHFTSQMVTRDVEYQKILDSDPREWRQISAKYSVNVLWEQVRANWLKKKVRVPVLFLLSGKDYLGDPSASKRIFRGLTVQDRSLIEYPEMLHALYIDLGREKVFGDILGWIEKRL
jgi:alpha-beta hydrolase superfamily lysophospholipase